MNRDGLDIRPYQLMCMVCKIGAGWTPDADDGDLSAILNAMRGEPDLPVVLRCNVDSGYRYQNPGKTDDTPEGDLFNEKRNLDILQRLGLVPGSTRPALELFERLFENIPTTGGICGYADVTSENWRGCPDAESGNYERGHAGGIHGVIPARNGEEKARVKKESVATMYDAEILWIRPHHLMCMVCFHDGRETLEPIEEDNLFEAIHIMQKNPEVPVTLTRGCCMICPPCGRYDPDTGRCVGGHGMNLRDQKKDLDVLQLLGLQYGDTLPARELYRMLFERIPSTRLICAYGDGVLRGAEWSICRGPEGSEAYMRARECRMGIMR